MYYGKKKKIIIISVVIALVLILGGVGAYLFLATDLFKSSETLFYKYLVETSGILKNSQLEEIDKLKQQSAYTTTGEATVSFVGADETKQSLYDEMFDNLKITVNGKSNDSEQLSNTNLKLMYGTQELFNLDVAKNENIYGVKSDEIVTSYLGVKNENLQVLAQKLGISGNIPNEISSNIKEILEISDEDYEHIAQTYLPVLQSSISKDKFSKDTDVPVSLNGEGHKVNAYRLDLTGDELVSVITNVLNTLTQDSVTLNLITTKAKALGLDQQYTQVNNLTKMINSQIKNLSKTLSEYKDGVSIVIYEENKVRFGIEIIIKNQSKVNFIYKNSDTSDEMQINVENLNSEEDEKDSIQIQYSATKTSTNTIQKISIVQDGTAILEISTTTDGAASLNNVNNTTNITFNSEEGETTVLTYTEQLQFVDNLENLFKLDNTNCAIINDYTTEQIQAVLTAVLLRSTQVYTEKLQYITNTVNNTINNGQNNTNSIPDITGNNGQNAQGEEAPITNNNQAQNQ